MDKKIEEQQDPATTSRPFGLEYLEPVGTVPFGAATPPTSTCSKISDSSFDEALKESSCDS